MDIRKNFGSYTGDTMDISSLININGYYVIEKNITSGYPPKPHTAYFYYMFFEDGIYLHNFSIENINKPKEYSRWGCYTLSGDTIKTKWACIYPPLSGPPYAFELWYVVIDKNTIKEIFSKPLYKRTQQEMEYYLKNYAYKECQPATFVPIDTLPNSDYCWLKKQKWFWANEENWKLFMEKLKNK